MSGRRAMAPPINAGSCVYEPWLNDEGMVGYKVTRKADGEVEYIYFNPSHDGEEDDPNVFVYIGPHGDDGDEAVHHYLLFDNG